MGDKPGGSMPKAEKPPDEPESESLVYVCNEEYGYEAFCGRPKGHSGRCAWWGDGKSKAVTHSEKLNERSRRA